MKIYSEIKFIVSTVSHKNNHIHAVLNILVSIHSPLGTIFPNRYLFFSFLQFAPPYHMTHVNYFLFLPLRSIVAISISLITV
jgi:hypothetical protein